MTDAARHLRLLPNLADRVVATATTFRIYRDDIADRISAAVERDRLAAQEAERRADARLVRATDRGRRPLGDAPAAATTHEDVLVSIEVAMSPDRRRMNDERWAMQAALEAAGLPPRMPESLRRLAAEIPTPIRSAM